MEVRHRGEHRTFPDAFLPVPASSVNILVVDDHRENREAFQSVIESLGFTAFVAGSGQEALNLVTRYRFALILLDVRMPVMDGLETAECLRRKPFARQTPILFVSAHQETAIDVSRASLPGLVDYLFSPVDGSILAYKIQSYVDIYLKNELLQLRTARLAQANEALHDLLGGKPDTDPQIRESVARLSHAIQGVQELVQDHQGD